MDFISILSIFLMTCFVGYYVVWSAITALQSQAINTNLDAQPENAVL